MRRQCPHSGRVSWHFTLRRLQFRQPLRDLVCPFRGMGRRLGLGRVAVDEDENEAMPAEEDSRENEQVDEELVAGSKKT